LKQLIKKSILVLTVLLVFMSCKKEALPKPSGFLRLEYPQKVAYQKIKIDCPFEFEIANSSTFSRNDKCWIKIKYPKLKAVINITYRPIKNNLRELLLEAEKLTTEHSIKADGISFIPYKDSINKVYGKVSDVTGNAASPMQFHITDSTKHFITGSLYFNVQPNYDSIYPAVKYLERDIIHLIETTKWK